MKESPSKEPLNFSDSSKALEDIVERFRRETLPLETALALFENGVGHVKICQGKLSQTRGRVEELVKSLQVDGEIATRPFGE